MCLAREEDQELIIIDWRAPVANLYYEGRLGEANYDCPEGNIEGEILLKRQFFIEEGELLNIFDIDVTATDELLQSCLGANADNRLKDIVSTIQAEQNQIIRADMWKPLVVQGAAGSGKTTIALHRIAYLIYNHEKNFKPENFMIIAPNRLFLNYISNVLPELGVDKVKQTTFEQFAWDILERRLKLTDPNDKLMRFVKGQEQNDDMDMLKRTSELKSSIVFKTMLDDFFESVLRRCIPKEDFKILDIPVFSYEEINSLFLKEYKNWPVMYRINEIKKYLINRLKQRKNDIINSLHDECDLKIRIIKQKESDPEKRQRKIIDAIEKRDDIISNLNKYSKKAVDDYVKGLPKLDPFKCYRVFIESWLPRADANLYGADENILRYTSSHTKGLFDNKVVELEDLAPLIYLKYIIFGIAEKIPVRHIVIDEGQDFSVFQLYVLKNIIKDSSFTILGDLCQGIHSYRGMRDWKEAIDYVFNGKGAFLILEQSYRTTVEIMDAANKVLRKSRDKGLIPGKPVLRHGDPVSKIKIESIDNIVEDIEGKIKECIKLGYKSMAVICKSPETCKKVFALMKKYRDDVSLITGREKEYAGGIVVVPSYLSKGLEFDAVFIPDADNDTYKDDELDIKLLYVAMTRPLHKLFLYYGDEYSPLTEDI